MVYGILKVEIIGCSLGCTKSYCHCLAFIVYLIPCLSYAWLTWFYNAESGQHGDLLEQQTHFLELRCNVERILYHIDVVHFNQLIDMDRFFTPKWSEDLLLEIEGPVAQYEPDVALGS